MSEKVENPCSKPQKLAIKCVQTCLNEKAVSFVSKGSKIEIATNNTSSVCALTDGSKKNGPTPEFEGASYILKNCTLSNKHGQHYLLLGRTSMKFRTAPLSVSEEAERAALDALCHWRGGGPLCKE